MINLIYKVPNQTESEEKKTGFKEDFKNNVAKLGNEVDSFLKNIGNATSIFKPKGSETPADVKPTKTKKKKKKKKNAKFVIDEDEGEEEGSEDTSTQASTMPTQPSEVQKNSPKESKPKEEYDDKMTEKNRASSSDDFHHEISIDLDTKDKPEEKKEEVKEPVEESKEKVEEEKHIEKKETIYSYCNKSSKFYKEENKDALIEYLEKDGSKVHKMSEELAQSCYRERHNAALNIANLDIGDNIEILELHH